MCAKCWYIDNAINELRERKKTMICRETETRVILHPERTDYYKAYYQKNREKKLQASLDRYYTRKNENCQSE